VLLAYQAVVFLVEGEAVVLDVVDRVALLAVLVGRADVVVQLGFVLLLVFVPHLLQLLLPQVSVLTLV